MAKNIAQIDKFQYVILLFKHPFILLIFRQKSICRGKLSTDDTYAIIEAMNENFLLEGLNEAQKRWLSTRKVLCWCWLRRFGQDQSISHRIAHLVGQGVPPEKILAITFTNKASNEMKERILGLLDRLPNSKS